MQSSDSRKLAVIVHADVVGSTQLVQRNETEAHARIQDVFRRFSGTIEDYGGKTRELRGDALLAEFDRASDAVCAALAFQSMNSAADYTDDEMHPVLRVGIALGEVIAADNTLTGAGVVLAQRLEQLAVAGGVCIQGAAYETLPQRLPIAFKNMGEQVVKGFSEPVRVFSASLHPGNSVPLPEPTESRKSRSPDGSSRMSLIPVIAILFAFVAGLAFWFNTSSDSPTTGTPDIPGELDERPSIAVLPFDNIGGDPDQEYFADGLADDLITDLSKIPGLFVTARNSSFAYRNDSGDIRDIATALGVRYILDGSVRRADAQVRINAQLVDADTGQHIWSERFDRDLSNIFKLQDEVTTKIVTALEINLDSFQIERDSPSNFAAYDILLRALEIQARFTPEDNAAGRELFSQAAALDPGYARAHAGIGLTHAIDVNMNWTNDRQSSVAQGLEAANRALELDATLPRAYFSKGSLLLAARQHVEAEVVMRRAVKLAPNYADGFAQLAFVLVKGGKHTEAEHFMDVAKQLNPIYPSLYLYVEAIAIFHQQRYEEALPLLAASAMKNPAFDRVHLMLAATHSYLGNEEEAEWAVEEADNLLPNLSLANERNNSVLLIPSDLERYLHGLEKAGLD